MTDRASPNPGALTVIAPSAPPAAAILGSIPLDVMKSKINELRAFVHDVMVEGTDYGRVPGVDKKFLWKPGAERLCQIYNLECKFEFVKDEEDRTQTPILYYHRIRCLLIHRGSGTVAGEGYGSASSHESKYRYRVEWWNEKKDPPEGEGWQRKKTKNGISFLRRTPNPDPADVQNTILKMGLKRAQIDAVLRVTGTSEFFAQDIDEADIDREDLQKPTGPGEPSEGAQEAAAERERLQMLGKIHDLEEALAQAKDEDSLKKVAQAIVKANNKAITEAMKGKYALRWEQVTGKKPMTAAQKQAQAEANAKAEKVAEPPKKAEEPPASAKVKDATDDLLGGPSPDDPNAGWTDPGPEENDEDN